MLRCPSVVRRRHRRPQFQTSSSPKGHTFHQEEETHSRKLYYPWSYIKVAKSGKYLGVTLSEKLSNNEHVDAATKKANNSLAFLRRNLSSCPRNIKAQCYETMVRPTLEYASTVWDPFTQRNIKKVEAVQRRAARFAISDYRHTSSPSQMIEYLGWQSLQNRRSNAKVVMVYRITYGLVDIPAASFFHPTSLNTRGHSLRYLVPYCRTETLLVSAQYNRPNEAVLTCTHNLGFETLLVITRYNRLNEAVLTCTHNLRFETVLLSARDNRLIEVVQRVPTIYLSRHCL